MRFGYWVAHLLKSAWVSFFLRVDGVETICGKQRPCGSSNRWSSTWRWKKKEGDEVLGAEAALALCHYSDDGIDCLWLLQGEKDEMKTLNSWVKWSGQTSGRLRGSYEGVPHHLQPRSRHGWGSGIRPKDEHCGALVPMDVHLCFSPRQRLNREWFASRDTRHDLEIFGVGCYGLWGILLVSSGYRSQML